MKKTLKVLSICLLCFALFLTSSAGNDVLTLEDAEQQLMSGSISAFSESFTPYTEDGVTVRMDTSDVEGFGEDDPFCSTDDFKTHFVHYADGDSRVSLPESYDAEADDNFTNVVGIVVDYDDDAPVPNAVIWVNGKELVTTDSNGRFQITNLPDGEYSWEITADGYMKGTYLHYDVSNTVGTNMFQFFISHDREIVRDRQEMNKYYAPALTMDSLNR